MHEFLTRTTIRAAPEAVWAVLTDPVGYAAWNPEVVGLDGRLGPGERVRARVKVGSGAVRTVPLTVTVYDPPIHMEWTGGLPLGLFTGRRYLTVTPRAAGAEFRMLVRMSGPLAGLMVRAVGDRQAEIDAFSAALKARVEAGPGRA